MKNQKIYSFYKRKANDIERDEDVIISSSEPEQVCENPKIEENEPRPSKVNRVNPEDIEMVMLFLIVWPGRQCS
jgi:hypothetical protein